MVLLKTTKNQIYTILSNFLGFLEQKIKLVPLSFLQNAHLSKVHHFSIVVLSNAATDVHCASILPMNFTILASKTLRSKRDTARPYQITPALYSQLLPNP